MGHDVTLVGRRNSSFEEEDVRVRLRATPCDRSESSWNSDCQDGEGTEGTKEPRKGGKKKNDAGRKNFRRTERSEEHVEWRLTKHQLERTTRTNRRNGSRKRALPTWTDGCRSTGCLARRITRWKDADASPMWQDRIFGGLSGLYGAVALIAMVRRAVEHVQRKPIRSVLRTKKGAKERRT